jgi:hypothetical protein
VLALRALHSVKSDDGSFSILSKVAPFFTVLTDFLGFFTIDATHLDASTLNQACHSFTMHDQQELCMMACI